MISLNMSPRQSLSISSQHYHGEHKYVNPKSTQSRSPFFQLPQEVRDRIYSLVFYAWYGREGSPALYLGESPRSRPVPNLRYRHALALLRTCRRARDEVGDKWMKYGFFIFRDPVAMLDILTQIGPDTLSLIRDMRVVSNAIVLSDNAGSGKILPSDEFGTDMFYRLAATLRLLPGLRLDTLTIIDGEEDGPDPAEAAALLYDTFNGLVEEGLGWRELRLVAWPQMFGYGVEEGVPERYRRRRQPSGWQAVLEGRDGRDSRPSAAVYIEVQGQGLDATDLSRNDVFEQELLPAQTEETYGLLENEGLLLGPMVNIDQQVLVVARRGDGVDYQVKEESPMLERRPDIRRKWSGKTWKEIKKNLCNVEKLYERGYATCEWDEGGEHVAPYAKYSNS